MTPALRQNLTLAVLVLTGINMRPLLTSIGPLLPDIRAASGMSYTLAALLTALPVIAMGVLALAAGWVDRYIGPKAQYCAEPADYRGRRPAAGNRPE